MVTENCPLLEWGHEMTSVLNSFSFVHPGLPELVRAIFRCGHQIGDTIVHGSATSHMVTVEKGEGECVKTNSHTHTVTSYIWIIIYPSIFCLIIIYLDENNV